MRTFDYGRMRKELVCNDRGHDFRNVERCKCGATLVNGRVVRNIDKGRSYESEAYATVNKRRMDQR